jgi:hypothetical protein
LIYFEEFDELIDARKRDEYLKTRKGHRELKDIFNNLEL